MESSEHRQDWLAVIGRALGYLCIQNSSLKDKNLAQKALFLDSIGISKQEIAAMLDSTAASITELIRQSRSSKKAKKSNGKKSKGKRQTRKAR